MGRVNYKPKNYVIRNYKTGDSIDPSRVIEKNEAINIAYLNYRISSMLGLTQYEFVVNDSFNNSYRKIDTDSSSSNNIGKFSDSDTSNDNEIINKEESGWLVSIGRHRKILSSIFSNGTIIASDTQPTVFGTNWFELINWTSRNSIPFTDGDTIINADNVDILSIENQSILNRNKKYQFGQVPIHGHSISVSKSISNYNNFGSDNAIKFSGNLEDIQVKDITSLSDETHNFPAGLKTKFWILYNDSSSGISQSWIAMIIIKIIMNSIKNSKDEYYDISKSRVRIPREK